MRTPKGDLLTEVILAVFRANGRLLDAGDGLVAPVGLTSARWQVLGSVGLSDRPLSAPQIASIMGITRQGVQKQINLLVNDGLLETLPNPGNKRSPLYAPTRSGRRVLGEIDRIQSSWVNSLAKRIPSKDLEAARRVLAGLCERISPDDRDR